MAEILRSEHTKEFEEKEIDDLQKHVSEMTPEELEEFRNSFDPDAMGHWGKEAI